MEIKEFEVPVGYGVLKGQIFGKVNESSKAILTVHGFLDNSNSFRPVAEYLTKQNYYLITYDLPGHGFSSHIPMDIPYQTSLMLMSIRNVVKHFNLKRFILMGHSFGSAFCLIYAAIYGNEVESLILLDLVTRLRPGFDSVVYFKEMLLFYERSSKEIQNSRDFTREIATNKYIQGNKHIDEKAALILLERGLSEKDGKVQYTRDIQVKSVLTHVEIFTMMMTIHQYVTCPMFFLCIKPNYLGEEGEKVLQKAIETFKQAKKSPYIEIVEVNGTHQYHMMNSQNTSNEILNFLQKPVALSQVTSKL